VPRLLLPLLLGPTFGSFEELGVRQRRGRKGKGWLVIGAPLALVEEKEVFAFA
jgi:hypothetical protein